MLSDASKSTTGLHEHICPEIPSRLKISPAAEKCTATVTVILGSDASTFRFTEYSDTGLRYQGSINPPEDSSEGNPWAQGAPWGHLGLFGATWGTSEPQDPDSGRWSSQAPFLTMFCALSQNVLSKIGILDESMD